MHKLREIQYAYGRTVQGVGEVSYRRSVLLWFVHTAETDNTRQFCLGRVDGVNTTEDRTRQNFCRRCEQAITGLSLGATDRQ